MKCINQNVFIGVAVLFSSLVPALATDCTIDRGYEIDFIPALENSTEISKSALIVLDKMQNQMDRGNWTKGKALGPQMSHEEATEFAKLEQKFSALQLSALIASKRERDLQVIYRMAGFAEKIFHEPESFQSTLEPDELKILGLLIAVREILVEPPLLTASNKDSSECNFYEALLLRSDDMIDALQFPVFSEAIEETERLNELYPEGFSDEEKMAPKDRLRLNEVRKIMSSAENYVTLSEDFRRLAIMLTASELLYQSAMQDQFNNSGDAAYVGTTWQKLYENGKISAEIEIAAGVIKYLDDFIPSEWVENTTAAFEYLQ
ncbi:hypothetical protein ABFZ85_14695 [Hyphococcus formosus]|uniref:hypothetical protein n=1 Tax=Hyphococcus formosus TaxID=3143534 RepID=UPI00398B7B46